MGWRIMLCLGVFLVAFSFCRCTEPTSPQTPNTTLVLTLKPRERATLTEGHGEGGGSGDERHGRLLIGHQGAELDGLESAKALLDVDADYQSDMGWEEQYKGKVYGSARSQRAEVERLLQMEPDVECTGDSMRLMVRHADPYPGSLFLVDRGNRLSPLPLSMLPPSCGYTLRSSWRELVLVAPYDGCFVTLEEDSYVLPLRWRGLPVRMCCPVMRQTSHNPPMVTCHAEGMVVKTEWAVSVNKIGVNVNGHWEPLMDVSSRCGFSVVVHPDGVVISARYAPCVDIKDGMLTIGLAGEGEIKVSCPSPLHLKPTQTPTKSPTQPIQMPDKGVHNRYPWSPHHVPSTRVPHQNPHITPQPAIPQDPVYPQYPVVPEQTSTQRPMDIDQHPQQPQGPYFPLYTNPFHLYSVKPANLQPLSPHVTKTPDSQQYQQSVPMSAPTTVGQVHQALNPLQFYSWPAHPEDRGTEEEPAILPQVSLPSKGQVEQPFYLYPFYEQPSNFDTYPVLPAQKPELQPICTTLPPVIQPPDGQMQTLSYTHPFYPQPPRHETLPTQKPSKLFHSYPFYPPPGGPSQKPAQPPITQCVGQERKPIHPFHVSSEPPAYEAPQGQAQQPLDPHYSAPSKPEAPEIPSPGKVPPGSQQQQPFYSFPLYPQPPKPPYSEAPRGQVPYPYHPPFNPEGPYQKPVPPTQHTPNQMPNGQMQQPLYSLSPEPSKPEALENPSTAKVPSGSQQQQSFYPLFYYPQPPASEAPQGQVHQPYPYLFYHPLKPEDLAENLVPPTQHMPSQMPNRKMQQPLYPLHPEASKPEAAENTSPGNIPPDSQEQQPFYHRQPKPSASEAPLGQVHQPFFPYPFNWPAKIETQPANNEKPQGPTNPQPSLPPQHPQPGNPYIVPVHCPQICPFGISNCCPQIAFHQHHHHIVPAGPEAKGTLPMSPGIPFFPALGNYNFGYGLESASLPHKPIESSKTSVGTTGTSEDFDENWSQFADQSLPFESQSELQPNLQPPDETPAGIPASYPNKLTEPDLPMPPYFVSYNSQYLKGPYQPQDEETSHLPNFPQSLSPAHSNAPSKTGDAGSDPLNQMHYFEPYNPQPPKPQYGQLSSGVRKNPDHPRKPYLMPYISKYLQQPRTSKRHLTAKELQPPGKRSSESESLVHPQDQTELLEPELIPYYMLQDSQAPPYERSSSEPNSSNPQRSVINSSKFSKPEPAVSSRLEQNGYVLLQHGPPGREPSSSLEFPLPFRDLINDTNTFLTPNSQRHPNGEPQHPQNLKQPQEKTQRSKQVGKGMFGLLPGNAVYMPSPNKGEEYTEGFPLHYSAPKGPRPASSPHVPFFNLAHLKPEFPESFKDFWKRIRPLGSRRRNPPHDPGQLSQILGSAANHQEDGLMNQPMQREDGHREQHQSEPFTENK